MIVRTPREQVARLEATRARPYHGPAVVLSREEAERVRGLLSGSPEPLDRAILEKCVAMLGSDPRWRESAK